MYMILIPSKLMTLPMAPLISISPQDDNRYQAACKILPALHKDPEVPVTWDETIDAVEAHKEVVLLKALCGAGVEGIAGLEGMVEEGGWT